LGVDQGGDGLAVMFGTGTSFAVPHVGGVAALAWTKYNANSQSMWLFLSLNNTKCSDVSHGILASSKSFEWDLNYQLQLQPRQNISYNTKNYNFSTVIGAAGCPPPAWISASGYFKQNKGGIGPNSLTCPAGCIVNKVYIVGNSGSIDWIDLECSNGRGGTLNGQRGSSSNGNGATLKSFSNAAGFIAAFAQAGGNLNGLTLQDTNYNSFTWGCLSCETRNVFGCTLGSYISGFNFYLKDDGNMLNSIEIECTHLNQCGSYQFLLNGYCYDCHGATCNAGSKYNECGSCSELLCMSKWTR
jgi:hypothetical protein